MVAAGAALGRRRAVAAASSKVVVTHTSAAGATSTSTEPTGLMGRLYHQINRRVEDVEPNSVWRGDDAQRDEWDRHAARRHHNTDTSLRAPVTTASVVAP